jgi:hypothetical protein
MSIVARIAGTLSCVAAVCVSGCGAGDGSATTALPAAVSPAIGTIASPHYMLPRGVAAPNVMPDTFLTYGNGPVLAAPKMYVILWGYKKAGDPDNVAKLIQAYGQSVGGSGYNNIVTQYYEMTGKKKVDIGNPKNQFGGIWDDETPIPKSPNDGQVAAEALRGVAHFGFDPNGSYFVATAHGHATNEFKKQFCAYHSSVVSGKNTVPYVNYPYIPDGGKPCGADAVTPAPADESAQDEGVTIIAGHELAESVTDPNPYSGWNSVQGEIADMCEWRDMENDPFGKSSWTSQPLFSDKSQTCVHSYP